MEIRQGDNCIILELVDRESPSLPSVGDVNLLVEVSSEGFRGQDTIWVSAPDLAAFLARLHALEEKRRGEAVVEGMSPETFRLSIQSVGNRGHMSVGGFLAKY